MLWAKWAFFFIFGALFFLLSLYLSILYIVVSQTSYFPQREEKTAWEYITSETKSMNEPPCLRFAFRPKTGEGKKIQGLSSNLRERRGEDNASHTWTVEKVLCLPRLHSLLTIFLFLWHLTSFSFLPEVLFSFSPCSLFFLSMYGSFTCINTNVTQCPFLFSSWLFILNLVLFSPVLQLHHGMEWNAFVIMTGLLSWMLSSDSLLLHLNKTHFIPHFITCSFLSFNISLVFLMMDFILWIECWWQSWWWWCTCPDDMKTMNTTHIQFPLILDFITIPFFFSFLFFSWTEFTHQNHHHHLLSWFETQNTWKPFIIMNTEWNVTEAASTKMSALI